jgi:hypothetical protein
MLENSHEILRFVEYRFTARAFCFYAIPLTTETHQGFLQGPRKPEVVMERSELAEVEREYFEKKGRASHPTIPRSPQPKEAGESQDSIYHVVFMILVGALLCFAMGVLDFLSQETASTTNTTNTVEYRE